MGKMILFKPRIGKVISCQTISEFTAIFPYDNYRVTVLMTRF